MKNGLVGLYRTDGNFQGEIVAKLNDDCYLMMHYEWLMGTATNMKIYTTKELSDFAFFTEVEDLNKYVKSLEKQLSI